MSQWRFRLQVLVMAIIMLGMALSSNAAQDNLLTNPGFEPPFEPVTGVVPGQIAQGWNPWFVVDSDMLQPEYYSASDTTNGMGVPRIRSGSDAQQYFSFFSAHTAGVYQRVTGVAVGDDVEFSVYAWLWSTSGDDPDVSAAEASMSIEVGIDPTGGEDAGAETIVWSLPHSETDQFIAVRVRATAEAEAVTVFVRSTVNQVLMNNVVYLDDASLVVVGPHGAETSDGEATAESIDQPTIEITEAASELSGIAATSTPEAEAGISMTEEASPVDEEATPELPVAVVVEATQAPMLAELTATPLPPTATPLPPTATLNLTVFPFSTDYVVERGDFVAAIAERFGTTVEAIITANALSADGRIGVGQRLLIPLASPWTPTETALPASEAQAVVVEPTSSPIPTVVVIIIEPTVMQTTVVPTAEAMQFTATPVPLRYVVRYGDTLSSIAAAYGVTTRELAQFNRIVNPNLLYDGQLLLIPVYTADGSAQRGTQLTPTVVLPMPTSTPVYRTYYVMPGDTLYLISVRFNVSLVDLIRINRIVDPNRIFVGQALLIP